jgi:DNA-damage-inducible protein J
MATANLSIRIDAELKKNVETCLKDMGMNMSTAITIYLKQIEKQQAIPFKISAAPDVNQETIEAINEGRRLAHDQNTPGYRNMESLIKALNS